jgi:hypothetical protein
MGECLLALSLSLLIALWYWEGNSLIPAPLLKDGPPPTKWLLECAFTHCEPLILDMLLDYYPLDWTTHDGMVELLLRAKDERLALMNVVYAHEPEICNWEEDDSTDFLTRACAIRNHSLAIFLLNHGVDPNHSGQDYGGNLGCALRYKARLDVISTMIHRGAYVSRDHLVSMIEMKRADVLNWLISYKPFWRYNNREQVDNTEEIRRYAHATENDDVILATDKIMKVWEHAELGDTLQDDVSAGTSKAPIWRRISRKPGESSNRHPSGTSGPRSPVTDRFKDFIGRISSDGRRSKGKGRRYEEIPGTSNASSASLGRR